MTVILQLYDIELSDILELSLIVIFIECFLITKTRQQHCAESALKHVGIWQIKQAN
ncbi:hypothetical protein [Acinetobacter marinus]|uniref:hypothetical protein n=1 Tax=Acinetobacter marinus TaxID=281375 RepID=UPI00148AC6DC|nr:hypothetical protein [Acinetobacter marinus]